MLDKPRFSQNNDHMFDNLTQKHNFRAQTNYSTPGIIQKPPAMPDSSLKPSKLPFFSFKNRKAPKHE